MSERLSAYYGPIKLEQWKERRREAKWDGARKKLLLSMLEEPEREIRSIETLCRASGTTKEECRRLLIEIDARGIRMRGNREGWALLRNRPLEDASASNKQTFELIRIEDHCAISRIAPLIPQLALAG